MELKSKLLDDHRGLYLYSTTPPRQGLSPEKIYAIAEELRGRLSKLDLDAINVYDIQEEASRTARSRPFPFLPPIDSREYAKILKNLTGEEIINYKCVVHHPREDFEAWLDESWQQFELRYLTLVGGSSSKKSYPGPTLPQAAQMTAAHKYDFTFGGVTIAERHLSKGNEHLKLIQKTQLGMKFFTSQVVYQPNATIQLLQDYAQKCRELNVSPVRIILTFAPCGHLKTLEFLKWLGVNVPPEAEQEIFQGRSPLHKSIEVCCSTWRRILDSIEHFHIPVGINVESISLKKDEIEASIDLFYSLKEILDSYYGQS
jgi:5,10-methylenetetrahydrofolate reductase